MPIDTGTTSIHVTDDDKEIFEKYNLEDKGVGNAYHTAAEEMDKHRELKQKKKEELQKKIGDIKEECEDWAIEFSEII